MPKFEGVQLEILNSVDNFGNETITGKIVKVY